MATFLVTNLNDSGVGSLRQALIDANANADADLILFSAGITGGGMAGVDDGVITLGGTQLVISNDVTINGDVDGDGIADITIDANDASRVMQTSADVTLHSLDIANGNAGGANGGAIYAVSGTLTAIRTDVRDSETNGTAFGGGIFVNDALVLKNSTVSGNAANYGGGIYLSSATTDLQNLTVSGNIADDNGGGIAAIASDVSLFNSTVTNNIADNGGGIHLVAGIGQTSDLVTTNSIISANTGLSTSADVNSVGAGSASVTANTSLLGTGVTIDTQNGVSIITDTPGLAALADNGGPVLTHALLPSSDAISAGNASNLPLDTDDLDGDGNVGEALPVDAIGNARVDATLDIGAVEGIQNVVVDSLEDEQNGDLSAGNLSLRDAISILAEGGKITFASSITGGNTAGVDDGVLTLDGFPLFITSALTIDGDVDGDLEADITISGDNRSNIIFGEADIALRSLDLADGQISGPGGAITTNSALSIVNSTIRDSSATGLGGAINGKDITLVNTSLFDNTSMSFGGAIYSSNSIVTLDNVTASGNTSSEYGGALSVNSATVTVRNSTITDNTADYGGGIEIFGSATLTLQNSIVAGNTGTNDDNDITGANAVFAQNSLLGADVSLTTDLYGNIFSDVPGLAARADNGGPVDTHALFGGSAAIGAGDAALLAPDVLDADADGDTAELLPIDANGGVRVSGPLDIGAVEGPLTGLTVDTLSDVEDGDFTAGNLSLREAIGLIDENGVINFAAGITGGTTAGVDDGVITLSGSALAIDTTLVIDGDVNGDGKADIEISANDASRVFEVSGAGTIARFTSLTISDGDAGAGSGGAILGGADTFVLVSSSTLKDSVAAGRGGAFYGDAFSISDTTVMDNTAQIGGGIAHSGSGLGRVINSTLTGNYAQSGGGALSSQDFGDLKVLHSTFTLNTNGGTGGYGGSAIHLYDGVSLELSNSIIAGNSGFGAQIDRAGTNTSLITAGSNLLGEVISIDADLGGNVVNNAAGLDVLRDNGGPVMTHDLLDTSPAIGLGDEGMLSSDTFDLDNDGNKFENWSRDSNGVERVRPVDILDAGAVQFDDDFTATIATAGSVAVAGSATGEVDFTGDTDWFAVTLDAGELYQIELKGDASGLGTLVDPRIDGIFDATGALIPMSSDDNSGAGTNESLLSFLTPQSGTYYIAAAGAGGVVGTYEVSVSAAQPPVTDLRVEDVQVSAMSADAGDMITVGYDLVNGGLLGSGGSVTGIYLSVDATITAADTLLASVAAPGVSGLGTEGLGSVVTLPGSLTPGSYFIGAIADVNADVTEFSDTNNASTGVAFAINSPPGVALLDLFGSNVGTFETIAAAVAAASSGFTIAPDFALYGSGPETIAVPVDDLTFDLDTGTSLIATLDAGVANISALGTGSVDFTGNALDNTFSAAEGIDLLDGAGGVNTVDYSASTGRVAVSLIDDTADQGFATGDALDNIQNLIGSDFNDLLVGTNGANILSGGDDADNITGRGGDDMLSGGDGADLMAGNNDNDTVIGNAGADTLRGNGGDDSVTGDAGSDDIFGGIGDDFISAGSENDSVLGQGDDDTILGDAGNDTLRGGSGNDSIEGGDDDDDLFGQGNNDTIMGGEGNDSIQGNAGSDRLFGGDGDDTLFSGVGGDRLDGGTGNDLMNGGGADNVRDVFVFMIDYEQDRINGFDQSGTDRLELDIDLWTGTPGLTAQQVVDTFGSLNGNGTILTLDFGNGDVLEVQNSGGITQTTFGADVFLI